MKVLAIDPGPTESAWLYLINGEIVSMEKADNETVLSRISQRWELDSHLAIEMVASYGMPVGAEVFETVLWTGRFIQAWQGSWSKVYRKEVKIHLCNSMRAKDSNIRQALLDKFPATGGGKTPQVGTKSQRGPLYGVKSDIWAALGVAVTYSETKETDDA